MWYKRNVQQLNIIRFQVKQKAKENVPNTLNREYITATIIAVLTIPLHSR